MNHDEIRQSAEWMLARDWKRKTAKRGGFNQSLFEHSIYELDALLTLWPILAPELELDEADLASLVVGIVVHDVGKETAMWQTYVLAEPGKTGFVPHVVDDLTQAAVDHLFQELGTGEVHPTPLKPSYATICRQPKLQIACYSMLFTRATRPTAGWRFLKSWIR